jgi:hypothetical protein
LFSFPSRLGQQPSAITSPTRRAVFILVYGDVSPFIDGKAIRESELSIAPFIT